MDAPDDCGLPPDVRDVLERHVRRAERRAFHRGRKRGRHEGHREFLSASKLFVKSVGWDEHQHPRDHGKFSSSPGAGGDRDASKASRRAERLASHRAEPAGKRGAARTEAERHVNDLSDRMRSAPTASRAAVAHAAPHYLAAAAAKTREEMAAAIEASGKSVKAEFVREGKAAAGRVADEVTREPIPGLRSRTDVKAVHAAVRRAVAAAHSQAAHDPGEVRAAARSVRGDGETRAGGLAAFREHVLDHYASPDRLADAVAEHVGQPWDSAVGESLDGVLDDWPDLPDLDDPNTSPIAVRAALASAGVETPEPDPGDSALDFWSRDDVSDAVESARGRLARGIVARAWAAMGLDPAAAKERSDAAERLTARLLDRTAMPAAKKSFGPGPVERPEDDPHHLILVAMLAAAEKAAETGADPSHALHALADLADDPGQLEHVLGGGRVTKSLRRLVRKSAGWQSQLHPRDDHGRFVSKDAIREAKADPAKATELRAKVTRPEQRAKLDAALDGTTDLRNSRERARDASADRKHTRDTRAKRASEIVSLALHGEATADHFAELADHLPHMTKDELRSARVRLDAKFGAGKSPRREQMVAALVRHAEGKAVPPANPVPAKSSKVRATDAFRGRVRGKSLATLVAGYGGIRPDTFEFLKSYPGVKEAVADGVPLGVFRKNGFGLDQIATEMETDGHFQTPADRHPGEHLLGLLRGKVESLQYVAEVDYDKALEAHYREMEDARRAVPEPEVAEALRVGEETGDSEEAARHATEGGGWLDDLDGSDGGPPGEEPAGEVDDSFGFGANEGADAERGAAGADGLNDARGEPQVGDVMEFPPTANGRRGFSLQVEKVDDDHAHLKFPGSDYTAVTIPRESLKQFRDDMVGRVDVPATSDIPEINAVASGGAKLLGHGDDGMAFDAGDKIVKVSSVVPFHPTNSVGQRTPEQAIEQARKQFETAKEMYQAGVHGIPRQSVRQVGDKVFTVRDKFDIPDKFTAEQLDQVRRSLDSMHAAGFALNDEIQVGVGKDGKVYHFDTGKAAKVSHPDEGSVLICPATDIWHESPGPAEFGRSR